MEVEKTPCHRCRQPAKSYEINVPDANAYCGLVCQTAQRERMREVVEDGRKKFRQFRLTKLIGIGSTGAVFEFLSSQYGEGALKIMSGVCDGEVIAAARVTGLNGFVKLRDYWVCELGDTIDPVIAHAIEKYEDVARLLSDRGLYTCMAMERATGGLTRLQMNGTLLVNEEWQFHFELVYAIQEARRLVGFRHGDLLPRNIFYIAASPRKYVLSDGTLIECRSPFRPLYGDFGLSSFDHDSTLDGVALCNAMEQWNNIEPFEVRDLYKEHERSKTYDDWILALANMVRTRAH